MTQIGTRDVRLDGEVFHAESAASPIMWKGERAVLVRVRDVEQRWQAQQEIDRVRALRPQRPLDIHAAALRIELGDFEGGVQLLESLLEGRWEEELPYLLQSRQRR